MDSTDEEGYPVLILDSLITGNKAGMCQTPLPRSHHPPHRRLMTNLGGSLQPGHAVEQLLTVSVEAESL